MKLNEIIELDGKEYKVELNRESALKIDQYVDMKKLEEKMNEVLYEDKSGEEIQDGENPFEDETSFDDALNLAQEQESMMLDAYSRAFWIWLYPCEKLNFKDVKELVKKSLEDKEKASYLTDKFIEFIDKSVEVRTQYIEEQKNLKALAK